jgi:hypothetical protein
MKIVNKFSKPVKIGMTILLIGVAVMAYGTYLNSDAISYYALLIIITGLFIYLAYSLNFVNKSNLDHTTTEKEKGKKRKK